MAHEQQIGAVTKVVDALTPFSSEERHRVIQAALAILGEVQARGVDSASDEASRAVGGLPPRARAWMKQNGVTSDAIQQVFHLADGRAEIIASQLPGNSKKEQTYNAYVLTGIAQLLAGGDASFDDKIARSTCEKYGCYDSANHSAHLRVRGNEFTGTKDKGWTLTAPGLRRGAELVKEMQAVS